MGIPLSWRWLASSGADEGLNYGRARVSHDERRQRAADKPSSNEGEALAQRIREGDIVAFEALFRAHYVALRRFAFGYTHSFDAAEDLAQEVMLAVWERRTEFAVHASPVAYLYRATRNRALKFLAHEAVTQRYATDIATGQATLAPKTDELVFASEFERAAYAHIDALPSGLREVYRLRHDGGLSNAEIADVLGISVPAVYMRMTRALKTLSAALAPWIE